MFLNKFTPNSNELLTGNPLAPVVRQTLKPIVVDIQNLFTSIDTINAAIASGGSVTAGVISVNGFTGVVVLTTTDIAEGANLYFTNSRAISSLLTGFVSGAGIITSADSILTAIQKLNGNIAATSPMTTLGDIIYENSTPAPARLAGNTTTTKKFLRQTGTGAVSAAPAWDTVTQSDVGITPTALTKTDDTNVTLTLGGTPSTALLQATSITAGWAGQLSIARGGTAASTELGARTNLGVNTFSDIYTLLGGTLKAYPIGVPIHGITTATTLTSQLVYVMLLELQAGVTYSGAIWWQAVKGNYTASNNNKIDVCSYSGGTLTQVATTGNDGTLWQTANTLTVGSLAFTGTFVAAANTAYFIRAIYSASATVTVPQIGFGGAALSNNAISSGFFTNSAKIYSILTAQTDLTTPQAMSAYSASAAVRPFIGLY